MSSSDSLMRKAADLWRDVKLREPQRLAQNTGAIFEVDPDGNGWFRLCYWSREIRIGFPDWAVVDEQTGGAVDPFTGAMLAYYFYTSDGSPLAGEWIAFTELPDGKFYTQAFQGYSGRELAVFFENNYNEFEKAALASGGIRMQGIGDRSFVFQILPKVVLMVVVWEGDEDFPPSYRILFDKHAGRHLTTDALAILGGQLTGKLMKGAKD